MSELPHPTIDAVNNYLDLWDSLENYVLQEQSLDKLFFETYPNNTDIRDILVKASTLNDFYSTNIFSIFPVAKHIHALNIDERLHAGDDSLVNEIALVDMGGGIIRNFYSFATKYCSHHFPVIYPIYDSYVEKVLIAYKKQDRFAMFTRNDLKDYPTFKAIIIKFSDYYGLNKFNLKDIDRYLWQLGKDYFPIKY